MKILGYDLHAKQQTIAMVPPHWLKLPAVMAVLITTPQVLERLGVLRMNFVPSRS